MEKIPSFQIETNKIPTKLIIEKDEIKACNLATEDVFSARNLTLARNQIDRPFCYYKLSNLSRTTDVEVLARNDSGLEHIDLPEEVSDKLAHFLREASSYRESGFDCFSFAHLLNDVPYEFGYFKPEKWDIDPLQSEDGLIVGDTVFISKNNNPNDRFNITHFAVYLGNSLYISKFGPDGNLIVTTLEEMQKGFGGNVVFKAVPKKT